MIRTLERLVLNKDKNDIDVWMKSDEIMRMFPEQKEQILDLLKIHRPVVHQKFFETFKATSI